MRTTKVAASASDVATAAALRVAVARLHRQLRTRAAWDVTPSQGSVLARVEQSGPLRLGVAADMEGMSPATMSKVVDSLVDDGLIERVADPLDGRASLLRVSTQGRELLQELRSRGTELLCRALAELDSAEALALAHAVPALEKLADRLQDTAKAPE